MLPFCCRSSDSRCVIVSCCLDDAVDSVDSAMGVKNWIPLHLVAASRLLSS